MLRLAVVGNPIMHSLSPRMQNGMLRARNIEGHYTALSASSVEEALFTVEKLSLNGINITSPFKEKMLEKCDVLSKDAEEIGAVNTMVFKDKVYGYNSDWVAVAKIASKYEVEEAVVVGAGGAGRSALYALNNLGIKTTLINRSEEKGRRIASYYGADFIPLNQINKAKKKGVLWILTLPVEIEIEEEEGMILLNAKYPSKKKEGKAKLIKGEEWLVEQGIKAFEIFTGEKGDYGVMKKAIEGKRKKRIFLMGMMGAGKTTVGKMLAEKLNMEFFDSDEIIEKNYRKIDEIFEEEGEERFREIESSVLKELVGKEGVIALGGGAIIKKENRALLDGEIIYLWADAETLFRRTGGKRPLLKKEGIKRMKELLEEREEIYFKTSTMIVNTMNKSGGEIAKKIEEEVNKAFAGVWNR